MLYSEFTELTHMDFINAELYHNEIEIAYKSYIGTKEEFCKIFCMLSDNPVLLDGFLSSNIYSDDNIDYPEKFYTVVGTNLEYKIVHEKHFYTKVAAILMKIDSANKFNREFAFHVR